MMHPHDGNPETKACRVLMVVPQYPYPVTGGLEKQSHELSKALLRLGVPVRVLSGRFHPGQPENETVEGVPVSRMWWPSNKLLRFAGTPFSIAWTLWRLRGDFDVLHLHQHSWMGLYVITLARLAGKPTLTKLPSVGEYGLDSIRKEFLGAVRIHMLLMSSAIVAMSDQSRSELLRAGYPPTRILSLNNGIDVGLFGTRGVRYDSSGVRVVFVGRLSREKLLDVLLRAWKRVHREAGIPVSLELLGEGPLRQEIAELRDVLSLGDSVRFAGLVGDVPARLAAADIFVLPSRIEGNSNAVLEAMAAGLPIVSTAVGGTPMQVGPTGARFLCPVGDEGALAEALLVLIRDRDLRYSVGASMRRRAEAQFDIRRIAGKYAQAYQLLHDGRGGDVSRVSRLAEAEDRLPSGSGLDGTLA